MQTPWYSPYGMPHSHSTEYTDIEAGLSYFAPQPTSYMTHPSTSPSEGSSEAAADVKHPNKNREEEVTPASNFYCSHVPHVFEWVFDVSRSGTAQLRPSHLDGGSGMGES